MTPSHQRAYDSAPALKRKADEHSPSPPPSPKRLERAASFISISSDENDNDDHNQQDAEPTLCKEQQDLVDLIMSGCNVFFTGSAGCGKSTVLKAAIAQLEAQGQRVVIVAPTGRAALNVGGMTTFSYLGWHPDLAKDDIEKVKDYMQFKKINKRLRKADVLVIDEISMIENNFLTRMEECLASARYGDRPWGGLQLIVTGDFCQLPPVKPFQNCWICGTKRGDWMDGGDGEMMCPEGHGPFNEDEDYWAFKSPAWEAANFAYVNLNEIHRQNDEDFIKILQKCRLGIPFSDDDFDLLFNHEYDVENATQLLCKRAEVDAINKKKFAQITQYAPKKYNCLDDVSFPGGHNNKYEREKYSARLPCKKGLVVLKDHRFDLTVELKQTQLVMLQVNLNIKKGLVNGSQGVIIDWERIDVGKLPEVVGPHDTLREAKVREFTHLYLKNNPKAEDQVWPVVRFSHGYKKTIYPVCVVNPIGDHTGILVTRTQIPLVSGWAITVHKSQGMTLDRAIVNLSSVFESEQTYVALSRVTSLRGLYISGGSRGDLSVGNGGNQQVHDFLKEKFGEDLFADHQGSTVGSP